MSNQLLTQRLHGKSKSSYTGVCLAVCHRVAETHGGAVRATGRVGATSSVFCPNKPLEIS